MSSNYTYVKTRRHKIKLLLVQAFGGKCCICGYNKCVSALSFHHIDPNHKSFELNNGSMGRGKGKGSSKLATIIKEAKKCIMLCSNCHSELHAGLVSTPKTHLFDEAFLLQHVPK